jgi:hypothetical protein
MPSQYLRWDLNPHAIAMDFESITSTIPSRRYCFWAKGDLNPWGSHPMVFKTIAIDRSAICHKQRNILKRNTRHTANTLCWPWQDSNLQFSNPKYDMSTNSITRPLFRIGLEPTSYPLWAGRSTIKLSEKKITFILGRRGFEPLLLS